MKPLIDPWNDVGMCYRNAEVLRKVGMHATADAWKARGEVLMARLCGKPGVHDIFDDLLRNAKPAGRA